MSMFSAPLFCPIISTSPSSSSSSPSSSSSSSLILSLAISCSFCFFVLGFGLLNLWPFVLFYSTFPFFSFQQLDFEEVGQVIGTSLVQFSDQMVYDTLYQEICSNARYKTKKKKKKREREREREREKNELAENERPKKKNSGTERLSYSCFRARSTMVVVPRGVHSDLGCFISSPPTGCLPRPSLHLLLVLLLFVLLFVLL